MRNFASFSSILFSSIQKKCARWEEVAKSHSEYHLTLSGINTLIEVAELDLTVEPDWEREERLNKFLALYEEILKLS